MEKIGLMHRPTYTGFVYWWWGKFLCTCVPVYLCTCVPVYLCTCVPVYLCTCVPVYLCTCVPVYLCICVSVYLCTCVPVYGYLSQTQSASLHGKSANKCGKSANHPPSATPKYAKIIFFFSKVRFSLSSTAGL